MTDKLKEKPEPLTPYNVGIQWLWSALCWHGRSLLKLMLQYSHTQAAKRYKFCYQNTGHYIHIHIYIDKIRK